MNRRIRLQHLSAIPITNGLGLSGQHDNRDWPRYIRTTDIAGPRSLRDDVFASQPPDVAEAAMLAPNDIVACAAGTVGKSMLFTSEDPACFAGFLVRIRPNVNTDARFLSYWMQSKDYWAQIEQGAVKSTIENFSASRFRAMSAPHPALDEQRRIADFLDDRVSRIDRIIAARRDQIELASHARSRLSYDVVRGVAILGERRDSHLDWLGTIPSGWGVLSVGSQFTVELGKMLDDKRQTGAHSLPYLRNTNVQWDEISVDDLKEMDIPESEYTRYTVRPGDLLICEGGQPGRSAIWDGRIAPLGFQKALHRARSRGRSAPGWLLECLRVAVDLDVFAEASGQTTIAHLTNEQLRSQRFPFPDREVQVRLLADLEEQRGSMTSMINGFEASIDLLTEYKSSLITAAVTGELDVSTAGSSIPG